MDLKLIPLAFKLIGNTDKVKRLIHASDPVFDELKKVWPEAAPLMKDIISRSVRLHELMGPTIDELKKQWPEIQDVFDDLSNAVWPELVRQWEREKRESTLPAFSVRWLQENLNNLGASPKLKVDGDIGKATRAAVTAYQKKAGINADGWAGPETIMHMLRDLDK